MKSRLIALLVAPAAVVVALVLLTLRMHFQPPTVPEYALVADAGASATILHPSSHFELEAAPEHEVQGAVTARAFLIPVSDAGLTTATATPLPNAPLEIGRDGSIHLAGTADRLFPGVAPGEWEVVLAIGRPELLPNDPRQLVFGSSAPAAADGGQSAWRIVRRRISLETR